jgi:hypothetical protein
MATLMQSVIQEPQAEAGDQVRSYVFLDWFMSEEETVESLMTDPIADLIKEEIWPNPFKVKHELY